MENRIAKLRKEAGLTQQQLADKLGLSRVVINRYERVSAGTIKADHIEQMAEILGVSPGYLMGWSLLRKELSHEEVTLAEDYRNLNENGKAQLKLRFWELSQIWYYNDCIINTEADSTMPVAAHADKATQQVLQAEVERIKKLIADKEG